MAFGVVVADGGHERVRTVVEEEVPCCVVGEGGQDEEEDLEGEEGRGHVGQATLEVQLFRIQGWE